MLQESEDAGGFLPVLNFVKLIISKGMAARLLSQKKEKKERKMKKGKQNQKEASQKTSGFSFLIWIFIFFSFFFLTRSFAIL